MLSRFIIVLCPIIAIIGSSVFGEATENDIAERLDEYVHNKENWPILHYAIEKERPDVAAEALLLFPEQATMHTPDIKLMESHFGSNAADDYDYQVGTEQGVSALELAVLKGYLMLAQNLLENGADPSEIRTEYFGYMSDSWEQRNGPYVYERVKFINVFMKHSNYWTRSILYWAIETNNNEMVQLLLQKGASLYGIKAQRNWRSDHNFNIERTCVHHAACTASDEILSALISYQRDVNGWEDRIVDANVLEVFRSNVNNGSDWPPLHFALESGDYEAFSILLEYGEDTNWQGRAPHSLLDMAHAHDDHRFLDLMVSY